MRWERLFAELEAQAGDVELDERDALVDELRDGDWAETSWHDLLGGRAVLDVEGAGRVEGEVGLLSATVVQLHGAGVDVVVALEAVAGVLESQRRADPRSTVTRSLGWGHVLRALRDDGAVLTVRRRDGWVAAGEVDVVGRDFVRLRIAADRTVVLPFAAIAVVSARE